MIERCTCIYHETNQHPHCERDNATHLVDLGRPPSSTAAMCKWCAQDWNRRHPEMEIMEVPR